MKRIVFIYLIILLHLTNKNFAQNDGYICQQLFRMPTDISIMTADAVETAVEAVWGASELNGGYITYTGTLTQNSVIPDTWTYSPIPNNKLILQYFNGLIIEFAFEFIDGYWQGNSSDFLYSHDMTFTTFIQNQIDIKIISHTYWNNINYWERTITGKVYDQSEEFTINVTNNGQYNPDIGTGIAIYQYWEEILGSSISLSKSVNISEAYSRIISHNSNQGIFAYNTEIWNNSSAIVGVNSYVYNNAHVFWAQGTQFADSANLGIYNQVIDGHQWLVEGNLTKNNQQFGILQFDGPVIDLTYGPNLVLHLLNGEDILLHTLIGYLTPTSVDIQNNTLDFQLMQNYPNPFNPRTRINYSLPIQSYVTLKVFDLLGNEIAKLVNEEKPIGNYEVEIDAANWASGLYFYRLETSEFIKTKKMILLK